MGTKILLFTASAIVLLSTFYQFALRDFIFITLGVGRHHQKISEFPYKCRRLHSPLLESCEDMVIDEEGRALYAACSSVASRREWSPGGDKYDISARDLRDHVSVLDLDHPGEDGLFGLRTLTITGDYRSSSGGKEIDVHGLDVEHLSPTRLRFWMINHRPPVDAEGNALDPKVVGANSTIEVFEHEKGSQNLEWIRTISDDAVSTPNNLVAAGDGGVLITNDHTSKTGRLRRLEMILGGGSVAYCPPTSLSSPTQTCNLALTTAFKFANGIALLPNNEVLVAHSAKGHLTSHTFFPSNRTLSPGQTIPVNMPMDNLSVDIHGDIYVAAFPKVLALIEAMDGEKRPDGEWVEIPSTVFRVRKEGATWVVEKVLEDVEGSVLPGSTVAARDGVTGMLWLGGVASPFVGVCVPV
ncbi:serum paraoxonase/arylesterase-like protein [Mollisia scopiformis]|uniref:Serum paraoxonase/arylesteras-like protein n=1 Tax=Mollisia scopiformis TaxID=149040 RepID=A0A194X1Y0_MOLSC|nr:serum paraoxonase/arylesterase-like protein [Mollisia scopiformis]KUJ14191.1 serum paraoxonase/arylesteras-like protein [Mollisia scopiformis]